MKAMPYRVPAAMPPDRQLVIYPRRTPTTGMMAFAGIVFGIATTSAMMRSVAASCSLDAVILSLGTALSGFFAWYGFAACVEAVRISISAVDDVTVAWRGPPRRLSFPLAAVRGVHVEAGGAGTSRIVLELGEPHGPIDLSALATADDLEPLATKLRRFLRPG